MDGKPYERDDLGDTHAPYRFGSEPVSGDGAYGDDARSEPPGTGQLPQRVPAPPPGMSAGPSGFTSARWGDPEPEPEPLRAPSGGYPEYSRLQYGPPTSNGGDRDSGGYVPPPAYNQPSYGQPPAYGQPGYGPPQYGPAPFSQPAPYSQPPGRPAPPPVDDDPPFPRGRHEIAPIEHAPVEPIRGPVVAPIGGPVAVRDHADLGGRSKRGEMATLGFNAVARRTKPPEGEDPAVRVRRSMPLWQELPLLLVVAFCLAVLIRTFLLQAFFIPSGSMEQTLLVGDRVLVNKIVYDVRTPERGEVVVFRGTDNWAPENFEEPSTGLVSRIGRTMGDLVGVSRPGEKDFIKRVIGLPGDRISCCDPSGRVYVNGKGIDEPYVQNNSPEDVPPDPRVCRSRRFDEVLVPPGQIFVMGDHRIVSQDSRCQGPVPIENVIGRAFVIVWPSSRWDTLNVPETFGNVPGPVALGPPGISNTSVRVGAAVITLPVLASLVVTTRTGRKSRWGRRTLRR